MLSEGREHVDGAGEGGELGAAGGDAKRGLELLRVAEPPVVPPPARGWAACSWRLRGTGARQPEEWGDGARGWRKRWGGVGGRWWRHPARCGTAGGR